MNAPAASRLCVDIFPACEKHGISPTRYLLIVNIAGQTVSLFEKAAAVVTDRRYNFVKKIPCSTSRFGIGQTEGSNRTPLGLHRIAEQFSRRARGSATRHSQDLRTPKSPRASSGWKGSNPDSIAAATWIRTRVTFTCMARRTR